MPKILKLIDACNECAHCHYYSGGQSECQLVGEVIPDKKAVAPFCPLVNYPSRIIADMDATIRALREPNTYGLVHAVLSHIATKLKTTLGTNGVITIALRKGEPVLLLHDHITTIDMARNAVEFIYNNKLHKLHPDGQSPVLYEEVILEGKVEPLWTELELA